MTRAASIAGERPGRSRYGGARCRVICEGLSQQVILIVCFFFSSRRRHTRFDCDWSSDVCSSDLVTPRGARKLGERALVRVFEHLKRDREGAHDARRQGGQAEPTGATRPWRFGHAGQIPAQRTGVNALVRDGPSPAPPLHPGHFELVEAETPTEAPTAPLLDPSVSMPL